ncbi:protein PALS2-like isoform X2 [Lineus longissimus]|uniref:protein PALS2-like isoform X2 n=1 Tax=Lineus longissimus TaxID=88925 RepID=UPI002B4F9171
MPVPQKHLAVEETDIDGDDDHVDGDDDHVDGDEAHRHSDRRSDGGEGSLSGDESLSQPESGEAAMSEVKDNIDELDEAPETDKVFIKAFLDDGVIQSLMKVHDRLEDNTLQPEGNDTLDVLKDALAEMEDNEEDQVIELRKILSNIYIQSMMHAHDDIASKSFEPLPEVFPTVAATTEVEPATLSAPADAIRMVGIRKAADEPLGITVRVDNGDVYIARILTGSFIERQGLLHVGDLIKEVNGQPVSTTEQLQDLMRKSEGSITLKVVPSYSDEPIVEQVFMRTHFNFDPSKDNIIPCKEAGLPFREGDILQILNRKDPTWWQAMRVDDDTRAGLIPSQELEEKRKSFVKHDYDYTSKSLFCGMTKRRKKKHMYTAKKNSELDGNELMIYEEVARLPPFQRQSLVLVGAPGVGRRSLKNMLIEVSPKTFGPVIPHTSRPPKDDEEDGVTYNYSERGEMLRDIREDKYLEHGEYNGNLYGVRLATIKDTIMEGKIPIIDCNPQAIKSIKTGEFKPYVVFIAAPSVEILRNMYELGRVEGWTTKSYTERDFIRTVEESARIERAYRHHFDCIIVNDNMEETYRTLIENFEAMSIEDQWVPISWVYDHQQ